MATVIRTQIEAFLDGLHDLIPKDLIAIFDHRELELMISGLPEIDCKHCKLEGWSLTIDSERLENAHELPQLQER